MIHVDFHTHSTCSDGLLTPIEMVKRAKLLNINYYALTDHDTTSGLEAAGCEAEKLNITFIPGIELSTDYNHESIHILGYFRDDSYNNKDLNNFLQNLKNNRIGRAKKMIKKLKDEFDITISYDNIAKNTNGVVARPHIAKEIIKAGYKYSFTEIFDKLIGKNCKAYVPITKISTEDGISLLKKYNALVFLAHPVLITKSPIDDFLKMDFDGIEAIYYQNSKEYEEKIINKALENNFLISAGSDFHGDLINDKRHGDIGCVSSRYPDNFLNQFLQKLHI